MPASGGSLGKNLVLVEDRQVDVADAVVDESGLYDFNEEERELLASLTPKERAALMKKLQRLE